MTDVQFRSRGEFTLEGVDRMELWEAVMLGGVNDSTEPAHQISYGSLRFQCVTLIWLKSSSASTA
jgi:hypothetical protein